MESVREKGGGLIQLGVSTSYKLRVRRNQAPNNQWVEQDLTETVNQEWNGCPQPLQISIPVDDAIKEMFDTAQPGGDFEVQGYTCHDAIPMTMRQ